MKPHSLSRPHVTSHPFGSHPAHTAQFETTRLGTAAMMAAVVALIISLVWPGAAHANTTFSFTNAGATGYLGPTQTQVNAAYGSGNTLNGKVTVNTQGVQEWVVPVTGTYNFTVVGGHGAVSPSNSSASRRGGRGARITAQKQLTAGQRLSIVVGQAGTAASDFGGGGGASFVNVGSRDTTTNLIVAGGGGGVRWNGSVNGSDGNTGAWGLTNGSNYFAGDRTPSLNNTVNNNTPVHESPDASSIRNRAFESGSGPYSCFSGQQERCGWTDQGYGGVAFNVGDGGAGWLGDGHRDNYASGSGSARAVRLGSSVAPVGGRVFDTNAPAHGGFGGGGGGAGGGGGGGGYTGGDGGGLGGGGGSFANGFSSTSFGVDTARAFNRGGTPIHGFVTVQLQGAPPTVVTNAAGFITTSAATVGVNVTNDGGLSVTARGVVWATTQNPALGGSGVTNISSGSGTGTFSVGLSGLSPGTTYYVRAYATNNMATSYGTQQSFTTLKLNQTLTFDDPLPSLTFGDGEFTVTPTTDVAELAPSLSASPAGVCVVTGPDGQGAFTVTIVGGGTCTLTASQGGNTTYNAATPVARSFTVARAAQAIDFPPVNDLPFAPTPRALSATTSSALAVTFASDTPAICTVSGVDLTTLREGDCTLVASQAGNDNFLPAADVTRSFTVTLASQTVTLTDSPQRTYGDAPFAPSTVSSTGVEITPVLSSSTPAVCTTDGTTVTVVASGACALEAFAAGDDRYLPASVQLQIAVARRELTLTGTIATESRVYDGTTDAIVAAGMNLNLNGVLAADTNDVTLDPTLEFANRQVGTHTVRVSGDSLLTGDRAEHYVLSIVGGPTVTATISQRMLTVTGPTKVTRSYDGTTAVDLPTCGAFALTGVLPQDTVTLTCPSSATAQAATVGTHQITPAFAYFLTGTDAVNYTFVQPSLAVDITKAPAQMWFTGGLVQVLQSDGSGIALPSVTVNPASAGTLNRVWHDGAAPSAPGRYRLDVTLDSQTHQAEPLTTFVSVIAVRSLPQGITPPTIGPLAPTDDNGEPDTPNLPPSDVKARKNNQPVVTTVTRPTDTDIHVEDDQSRVSLTFRARGQATADPRPLGAELDLVLLAGGVLDVTGSGFKPNSHAEVWIFSDPQLMGVVDVDATGAFVAQVDVPSSLSAGEHVLQLNGTTSTDLLGSFSLGVLVEVPVSDEPAPFRSGTGQPFTAPAGGPAALMAGRHLAVSVTVAGPRQVLGGTQQTLTISSNDAANAFVVRVTPQPNGQVGFIVDRSVVLSRGATLSGSVEGFAPFTSVQVWMLSEPRQLGQVITSGDGAAEVRISMPQDVAYGLHTLQFVATTRTGQPVGVAVGLWVTKDRQPFVDVSLAATHGAAIATLAVYDHVAGFSDGMFKPQATITRGHAATMMANLFGFDASDAKDMFTDTGGTTHGAGIAALAAAEVATGFANGTFQPSAGITRGQVALLLARVLDLDLQPAQTGSSFSDIAGRIDAPAITVLHERGFVTGFADGTFRPDVSITREQFASMVMHAYYLQQAR